MAALVFLIAMLAIVGASDAAYCVCRSDVSDTALQKSLDYACGAGADCTPVIQGGSCYSPNTVRAHCSYAVNSYYQRKGQGQQQGCDFSGTATLTNSDPSSGTCSYPASSSAAGTSTSTSSSSTGSTTPSTMNPTTGTGGVLGGLGPSGNSISTDEAFIPRPQMSSLLAIIILTGLMVFDLRG